MSLYPDYVAAMAASYANQEGGITIPPEKLDGIVEIPLGFQPLGISVRFPQRDHDEVAIAAYFEPAVCLASVKRDQRGLHFTGSWIRGVKHGTESVRLFSGKPSFSDSNRAQAIAWLPDGRLVVTRNGERELFFLRPPSTPNGKWELDERQRLPGDDSWMVQSMSYDTSRNVLWVVESDRAESKKTQVLFYVPNSSSFVFEGMGSIVEGKLDGYFYGVDCRPQDMTQCLITDFRCPLPKGIYRRGDEAPLVKDVWGTGLCFLTDGSALVTRYGQGAPGFFNGLPGALIYVPAHMFNS